MNIHEFQYAPGLARVTRALRLSDDAQEREACAVWIGHHYPEEAQEIIACASEEREELRRIVDGVLAGMILEDMEARQ